jgi:hypothetical protein
MGAEQVHVPGQTLPSSEGVCRAYLAARSLRPAYLCCEVGANLAWRRPCGAAGEAAGGSHRAGREACAGGGGARRRGCSRSERHGCACVRAPSRLFCGSARAVLPSLRAPADAAPVMQSCCAKRSDAKQNSTRQISPSPVCGYSSPSLILCRAAAPSAQMPSKSAPGKYPRLPVQTPP